MKEIDSMTEADGVTDRQNVISPFHIWNLLMYEVTTTLSLSIMEKLQISWNRPYTSDVGWYWVMGNVISS